MCLQLRSQDRRFDFHPVHYVLRAQPCLVQQRQPFPQEMCAYITVSTLCKVNGQGCIRRVSVSNPGPPRGFNGCRVFPAEECLDRIRKNTVNNRCHGPAGYNFVTGSSTVSLHSSHCEGYVRRLSTTWLNTFDLKTSGYYMHRYVHQHSEFLSFSHRVCLRVLYGSHNKQRLYPCATLTDWFL